ncbi:hypothetical protein AN958_02031 [Leucoagaricus sp. SymC.cos]|nr:hypothetical protein AN958_02031 [Leucoagaricus sp. SymC.cos]
MSKCIAPTLMVVQVGLKRSSNGKEGTQWGELDEGDSGEVCSIGQIAEHPHSARGSEDQEFGGPNSGSPAPCSDTRIDSNLSPAEHIDSSVQLNDIQRTCHGSLFLCYSPQSQQDVGVTRHG